MDQLSRNLKLTAVTMLILLAAGVVAACGATPAPTPLPLPTDEAGEVAVMPPPTPTVPATPTPPPAIMAPNDSCETCHTNQEMLIATADEEEVVESLSEGEG